MFIATVLGENATLQPPPTVNVTFEEITEDPRQSGLFTVNVTWSHPNGMFMSTHHLSV